MNCQWTKLDNGKLRCVRCAGPDYPSGMETRLPSDDPATWPQRNCLTPPEPRPDEEQAAYETRLRELAEPRAGKPCCG